MKRLLILLLLTSKFLCFGTEEMVFKLGILSDKNEMVSFEQEQELTQGEQFKFLFEALEQSYIYLFAFSNNNELVLMHPSRPGDFEKKEYWNRLTFVPAPGKWLTIPSDGPGTIEVFIVASPQRLKKLEAFIKPELTREELSALYKELLILQREYILPPVIHQKAVSLYGVIKAPKDQEEKMNTIEEIHCSSLYMEWYKLDF